MPADFEQLLTCPLRNAMMDKIIVPSMDDPMRAAVRELA